MLFSAANTTEAAMANSIRREGKETTPSVARLSVIEWARVNAVTILITSRKAAWKLATGVQPSALATSTAGNKSESRNRM